MSVGGDTPSSDFQRMSAIMLGIQDSAKRYEEWLGKQLAGDLVDKDLARKHDKMRENTFSFLRATYWRWAETILEACPELADAPAVLGVGDIHLENYGTWRDADGRLAWGINDFDEAAEMPYVLDIVRLAASAVLGRAPRDMPTDQICTAILDGYRAALKSPKPIVLDRDYHWLRELVAVSDKKRAKFWEKIAEAKIEAASPAYRKVLAAAMPEAKLAFKTARRVAGTGSLGRPRWIGIADWRGAPVVREAKALVPSAWTLVHGGTKKLAVAKIAEGRHRATDPWFAVEDSITVRRLSPNNRKVEVEKETSDLLTPAMLGLMAGDIASAHLGAMPPGTAIAGNLARRERGWLQKAVLLACEVVARDQRDWASTQ